MTSPPSLPVVAVKLTKAQRIREDAKTLAAELPPAETCASCRYGVPVKEAWRSEEWRECRRNPPIMVEKRSSCARWYAPGWPEINANSWCGEYTGRAVLQSEGS